MSSTKYKISVKHYLKKNKSGKSRSVSVQLEDDAKKMTSVYVQITAKRQTTKFPSPLFTNYPHDIDENVFNEHRSEIELESKDLQKFLQIILFGRNDAFQITGLGYVYYHRFHFSTLLIVDDYIKDILYHSLQENGFKKLVQFFDWDLHIRDILDLLIPLSEELENEKINKCIRRADNLHSEIIYSLKVIELIKYTDSSNEIIDLNSSEASLGLRSLIKSDSFIKGINTIQLAPFRKVLEWNFYKAYCELTEEKKTTNLTEKDIFDNFLNVVIKN